jgi:hypothetical protein
MTTEQLIEWIYKEDTDGTFDLIKRLKDKSTSKWLTNNLITIIKQDFENKELIFEKIPEYIKYLKSLGLDEVCEYLNEAKHKFRKQKLEKLNAL